MPPDHPVESLLLSSAIPMLREQSSMAGCRVLPEIRIIDVCLIIDIRPGLAFACQVTRFVPRPKPRRFKTVCPT